MLGPRALVELPFLPKIEKWPRQSFNKRRRIRDHVQHKVLTDKLQLHLNHVQQQAMYGCIKVRQVAECNVVDRVHRIGNATQPATSLTSPYRINGGGGSQLAEGGNESVGTLTCCRPSSSVMTQAHPFLCCLGRLRRWLAGFVCKFIENVTFLALEKDFLDPRAALPDCCRQYQQCGALCCSTWI